VWRTLKNAGFNYLETRSLNQDPLENTFGVIRFHCGSNNNPTVGEFVDALKTISSTALRIVCVMRTVRVMTLSFWIIYIPSSRNLVLHNPIHPQVTVRRPFMMVLAAHIAEQVQGR
jgi:hypothetical protein